ncbi:MAG: DUF4434 domain-containing protein [Clostridia bacterium]|nr:DUF4434 domain-containing protein [Clostridia bacterium]
MTKKLVSKIALALAIVLVATLATFGIVALCSYNGASKNLGEEVLLPTVDFVQPWMVEWYTENDYQLYFENLAKAGYDTVIFQYSVTGNVNSPNLYFPKTSGIASQFPNATDTSNHVLPTFLQQAEKHGFDVFVGLSSLDDWWTTSNYLNADYTTTLCNLDCLVVDYLQQYHGQNKAFVGYYWASETFSNPFGWQKGWIGIVNGIIDHLNATDSQRPLMLSPFRHKFLPATTARLEQFWTDFVEQVNFRKGDIFAPQDSLGKINNGKADSFTIGQTARFVQAVKSAVDKKDGVELWLNCELFASKNLLDGNLYTADLQRMDRQFAIAKAYATRTVTFSFSHYCLPQGTNGEPQALQQFYQDYLNYISTK